MGCLEATLTHSCTQRAGSLHGKRSIFRKGRKKPKPVIMSSLIRKVRAVTQGTTNM